LCTSGAPVADGLGNLDVVCYLLLRLSGLDALEDLLFLIRCG